MADICTEQRGQLELQPKFWLCSCRLERERHREIQVCLLQFSSRPKITVDAHISDIMSCRAVSDSRTFFFCFFFFFCRAQMWLADRSDGAGGGGAPGVVWGPKNAIPLCPVLDKAPSVLIIPAAFTSANQLINSVFPSDKCFPHCSVVLHKHSSVNNSQSHPCCERGHILWFRRGWWLQACLAAWLAALSGSPGWLLQNIQVPVGFVGRWSFFWNVFLLGNIVSDSLTTLRSEGLNGQRDE